MKKSPVHPQVGKLLGEIVAFCEKTNCTRTSFGIHAVGDGNFIRSLEAGRMPMFSTIDRVRDYIRNAHKREK